MKWINVTIESPEGTFVDFFQVCHIASEDHRSFTDEENIGSSVVEKQLIERLRQYLVET